MKKFTNTTAFIMNDDMIASNMDGEIVMMSIERGEYFGLNAVGSRIWKELEKPATATKIIEMICNEFEIDKEQCEKDVMEFLRECLKNSMISFVRN